MPSQHAFVKASMSMILLDGLLKESIDDWHCLIEIVTSICNISFPLVHLNQGYSIEKSFLNIGSRRLKGNRVADG